MLDCLSKIEAFALTDMGKIRKNNEDALLLLAESQCYVVSDGMGGGKAGEVASSMMINEIESVFAKPSTIPAEREGMVIRSACKVNELIRAHAEQHNYASMGATFVCLLMDPWHPGMATVFHAGDSRVYRVREEKIELLTEDHTVAAASKVDENQLAPMFRGVLTNALGTGAEFFLERTGVDVQEKDIFIICSDGLSRMIPDSDILYICNALQRESCEMVCSELVKAALDNGGRDNISVIVVRINKAGSEYQPTEEESEIEAEAQVRNLMDLSDTPSTEVLSASELYKKP
ncbi:MAG: serine/threonine-protein phosphatase [Lentisphaeria bacterium]|nr:serine/threonine-protein phosphatase [Lentisphaeria bacterium]